MDFRQKLKDQGWYITDEGVGKLPDGLDKSDTRKVVQSLLDIDLRDVAAGALPSEISKKDETVAGKVVLQIAKIRNISAPKANEESKTAPRFLHLELTDGVSQAIALEFEHISTISLNTPPGTKIFLRTARIPLMQGILLLRPSDVQVLGGKVPALVEKWELSRTLLKYARGGRIMTGSSGPPPWIPFGQKIQQIEGSNKKFKSLGAAGGDKETKENNEFDAMRNEAIAEAAKIGAKKIFGGGNQQILDHNVKKIIEKGYSEDEATNALKATRNNLERALYNLKRREENRERSDFRDIGRGAITGKRGTFRDTKRSNGKEEIGAVPTKPAGNVSLFDFLTDKLPANADSAERSSDHPTTKHETSSKPYGGQHYGDYQSQSNSSSIPNSSTQQPASLPNRPKFENNISSSFANRGGSGNPSDNESGYRNRNKNIRGGGHSGGSNPFSSRHSDTGRGGLSNNSYNRNQNRSSYERERNSNYTTGAASNESRSQRNDHQRNGFENKSYNKAPPSSRYPAAKDGSSTYAYNNNRNYSDNRQTASAHSDTDKMTKLVDDTAKLKIEQQKPVSSGRGNHHHNSQRNQSNSQQNNRQQSVNNTQSLSSQQQPVYTQLPNGFAYDPNKIMGFQNKETNDFAMTMLKGQTIPPPNTHPQFSQPPPSIQLATAQPGAFAGPQFLMQAQHVPAFGMNPIPNTLECGWNWKIGDRCLAKYWDDGRYYDAEITGLSDKTCVVWFLGYGNYEEVLKSDCLPITDAQNRPINNSHPIAHQQDSSQQQQQSHPGFSQMNARGGASGSAASTAVRYRGERQMYVPPPKREI